MKRLVRGAALVLGLACFLPDVSAQQGVVGQWRCRHANQTLSNNNFENWMYEFGLALDQNGRFQEQGNYIAATAGFAVPFGAQGQWQQSQRGVILQGGEQRQDGTRQPFTLVFTIVGPGSMSNHQQSAYGKLLTYCQR